MIISNIPAVVASTIVRPVQSASEARVVKRDDFADEMSVQNPNFIAGISSRLTRVQNPIRTLVAKVLALQEEIAPREEVVKRAKLARQKINGLKIPARDFTMLRQLFRRAGKGNAADDLDLFAQLLQMATEDSGLRELGYDQDALMEFAKECEELLQAQVNIHQEVKRQIEFGADGMALKALYEEVVVRTASVLQALRSLGQQGGMQTVAAWKDFLSNACAADLDAIDVGADKVHLQWVLRELKGMRIFNMLVFELKKLQDSRLSQLHDDFFQVTLDYVEEPYMAMSTIEQWVAASTTTEQILFFQDYRKVYSAIPTEAYLSEEQKGNSKKILQDRIDELIYSE